MPPVDGLDQPCPACGRVSGDHTLREWAVCLGTTREDLPYEDIPDDGSFVARRMRQMFQLPEDTIVADSVVVRAAKLSGATGAVGVKIPAVIHEFQIGRPDQPPLTVANVVYVSAPDAMRAYGRLVRDSANGAANAVERGG